MPVTTRSNHRAQAQQAQAQQTQAPTPPPDDFTPPREDSTPPPDFRPVHGREQTPGPPSREIIVVSDDSDDEETHEEAIKRLEKRSKAEEVRTQAALNLVKAMNDVRTPLQLLAK
ncbi:unnamed protein product [Peniophora sp. CBMAI 1063]|nr:unnamed protein product [Peniophora sp. CBMAI 1063]